MYDTGMCNTAMRRHHININDTVMLTRVTSRCGNVYCSSVDTCDTFVYTNAYMLKLTDDVMRVLAVVRQTDLFDDVAADQVSVVVERDGLGRVAVKRHVADVA